MLLADSKGRWGLYLSKRINDDCNHGLRYTFYWITSLIVVDFTNMMSKSVVKVAVWLIIFILSIFKALFHWKWWIFPRISIHHKLHCVRTPNKNILALQPIYIHLLRRLVQSRLFFPEKNTRLRSSRCLQQHSICIISL